MQLTELKLRELPGQDAGLQQAVESLWVLVGSVGGGAGSHSQALDSLLDLGELRTAFVCGNLNHRLDQELAVIWKCPVHTQPHL